MVIRMLGLTLSAVLVTIGAPALSDQTTFDCVIDPASIIRLGGTTSGSLAEVLVDRGDPVAKGQVVAMLDSELERATVELLRLRANNRETIEAYIAELVFAKKQLDRLEVLVSRDVASVAAIDQVRSEAAIAERNVANAELDQEVAQMELRRAEIQLERRKIKSPIDGLVVSRLLSPGEYLTEEGSVLVLTQLDPLYVEVFLPVELYGQIGIGDQVVVEPDAPVGGQYEAEIAAVDQVFDTASGTFGVRLLMPNPDSEIPGGLRCLAKFTIDSALVAD